MDKQKQAEVDRMSVNLPVVLCPRCENIRDESQMVKVNENYSVCSRCYEFLEFRDGDKDLI